MSATALDVDTSPPVPVAAILALGITQIIGYGTLYYSFSILAPDMAKDFGWTTDIVFAIFSGALLIGGFVAPIVGRWMDRYGAAHLMAAGSAISAVTLILCANAFNSVSFVIGVVALEIASALVLYSAAFAVLVETTPTTAQRSITYLTLIAGFASTLFWPVTTSLHEHLTWREVYIVFGVLNFFVCLPLHLWLAKAGKRAAARDAATTRSFSVAGVVPPDRRFQVFLLVATGFALQGFVLAAFLFHMVPLLTTLGLAGDAVFIASLFGPAQVLSRLTNMLLGRNVSPLTLAMLSSSFMLAGTIALLAFDNTMVGAIVFAVFIGLGSGLNSIVQGALPLWLFGSKGYGEMTGRISSVRLVVAAAAPFILAVAMNGIGTGTALTVATALVIAATLAFAKVAVDITKTNTARC